MVRRKSQCKSTGLFVILSEGRCTEPNYFRPFREMLSSDSRTRLKINDCKGTSNKTNNALGMIPWAEHVIKKNRLTARDRLWIVLDKDKNSTEDMLALEEWCRKNNAKIAFSNPCFEFWLLLHFEMMRSMINPEDLRIKLTTCLREPYDKTKDYSKVLLKRIDTAKRNARSLTDGMTPEEGFSHNPYTDVHRLVEELEDFITLSRQSRRRCDFH